MKNSKRKGSTTRQSDKKRGIFLGLICLCMAVGYGDNQSFYDNLFRLSKQEIENRNYAKSLEYLMEIKVDATEKNLPDIQVKSLDDMGIVYTEILDYEKAMECYLEANQILSNNFDYQKKIRILNSLSRLYFLSHDYDKTVEYLNDAYEIAVEFKDTAAIKMVLVNMGIVSNRKEDWQQTGRYLDFAMEILKTDSQDRRWALAIQMVQVNYFYIKQEYNLAEQLVLNALKQDVGKLDKELEVEYSLLLSRIYYKKKKYAQAISIAEESLKNKPNLLRSIETYEHLADIYRAMNLFSRASQYQDSIITMKDSLLKLNNMSQILRGQVQFDLKNLEKKLVTNKERQRWERVLFAVIFLSFVAVFLLILSIRSAKNKQLRMVAEQDKNEKLLLEQRLKEQVTLALLEQERINNEIKEKMLLKHQLTEQETLALLEQKMYKNEIELRNKQLVAKTLFQTSKNELMEEIIQELSRIPNQSEVPGIQPIIQKLKLQLKEPAAADWNSFLTYFEQTNPLFLSNLKSKHIDLSANEIRLSAYIYLNLDTKEISKLLHITPEYCKKKKQRLAQKLNLPSSKIYSYLSNIV